MCGATKGRVVERVRDRMYGLPGEWDLWGCACGLLSLDDAPTGDALSVYYPKQASENSLASEAPLDLSGSQHRFDTAHYRSKFDPTYRSAARPLLKLLPLRAWSRGMQLEPGKRHLDVGCHTGRFLELTRALGMEVAGVELDPHAAEAARAKGLDVFQGTLHDAKYPDASFDVVTLNHVFEHLPNPVEHLDEIHRILKPGGTLVLATPNPSSLLRKTFGEAWLHVDAPRHLHLYPPKVLARLAGDHGFAVKRTRYLSSYRYFLGSLRYRRNDRRGEKRGLNESYGAWENRWFDRLAAAPLGLINVSRQGEEYEMFLVKRG